MRHRPSLQGEWERLKALDDAKRRGYEFQSFIGSLFRKAHFTVTPNAGAGGGRQVDLMATMGAESFLVETKWWSKKLSVAEVASLEDRLSATPASVVGVLVNHAGFTPEAVARVKARASRPILLVIGDEVERAVAWDDDFVRLLRQKRSALLVHSKVLFMSSRSKRPRRGESDALPSTSESVLFRDGTRSKWLSCCGDFGEFTFVRELPDIDWVPGSGVGVTLDVAVPSTDQDGLIALLHELSNMGWLTGESHWSIQQASANWHGSGPNGFTEALIDWESRYTALGYAHHTEEFCYFDYCDDLGFYTLTGQVAAHSTRAVWQARLSFQLSGIPVDVEPLRHLCNTLDAQSSVFRPRNSESIKRHDLRSDESVQLEIVAFIVDESELGSGPKEQGWAVGVVATNPYWGLSHSERPKWWPDVVAASEWIVCSLRNWHQLDGAEKTYRLWGCESAWTSDAFVFRPLADWNDDQDFEEITPNIDQAPESVRRLVKP